ncbi:MAG: cytochrome d ubiquinol oxidase subunit II, partial [Planctomycetes bacterium RBG_16_55_9]
EHANTLWFLILGGLLAVYIVLDGYDLGIGVIHLFTADRKQREHFLALVGPFWDGNEVWLIIGGGVLFAVFPRAYAALLSGFYPYFIVLLGAFIVRGLALGLRDAWISPLWHRLTDVCFGGASLLAIAFAGIVGANLARGVPTDKSGIIHSDLGSNLNLPTLLLAVLLVTLLATHGSLYAAMKSRADQRRYTENWAFGTWALTFVLAIPAVALNVNATGIMGAKSYPVFFALVTAALIMSFITIPWTLRRAQYRRAFLSSSLVIVLSVASVAMLLFPRLLRSGVDDGHSLTIYSAAATHSAMRIMLLIVAVAIPLAIAYTVFVRVTLERAEGRPGGY